MTDMKASDQDVNRAIRSWLHEDRHEDASRIAGAVLDHVEATPRRRATWWPAWRTQHVNKMVALGLGAAAVVVALFVGAQFLGSSTPNVGGPGVEPTPTPTAEPTPTPLPPAEGGVPEGPFMILTGQGDTPETNHPPLTVTVPAPGWNGDEGAESSSRIGKDRMGPE
jgi:hypothetical protein